MRSCLVAAFLLTACASAQVTKEMPPAPVYEDPFVRLYNADSRARLLNALTTTRNFEEFENRLKAPSLSASIPVDEPFAAKYPSAVVITENAQAFLKYLDAYGVDPQYTATQLVAILRMRFPRLVFLDDLAAANRSHVATTVLLDVQAALGARKGDRSWLEASYYVFDERMVPRVRYVARAERIGPFPMTDDAFRKMSDKVARDLHEKMQSLLSYAPSP